MNFKSMNASMKTIAKKIVAIPPAIPLTSATCPIIIGSSTPPTVAVDIQTPVAIVEPLYRESIVERVVGYTPLMKKPRPKSPATISIVEEDDIMRMKLAIIMTAMTMSMMILLNHEERAAQQSLPRRIMIHRSDCMLWERDVLISPVSLKYVTSQPVREASTAT